MEWGEQVGSPVPALARVPDCQSRRGAPVAAGGCAGRGGALPREFQQALGRATGPPCLLFAMLAMLFPGRKNSSDIGPQQDIDASAPRAVREVPELGLRGVCGMSVGAVQGRAGPGGRRTLQ